MKVTIDIDCTPDEARTFLGLPDVKPMQETMLRQVEERLKQSLQATDPEVLIRTWLPVGLASLEQIQKIFFQFAGSAAKEKR